MSAKLSLPDLRFQEISNSEIYVIFIWPEKTNSEKQLSPPLCPQPNDNLGLKFENQSIFYKTS